MSLVLMMMTWVLKMMTMSCLKDDDSSANDDSNDFDNDNDGWC